MATALSSGMNPYSMYGSPQIIPTQQNFLSPINGAASAANAFAGASGGNDSSNLSLGAGIPTSGLPEIPGGPASSLTLNVGLNNLLGSCEPPSPPPSNWGCQQGNNNNDQNSMMMFLLLILLLKSGSNENNANTDSGSAQNSNSGSSGSGSGNNNQASNTSNTAASPTTSTSSAPATSTAAAPATTTTAASPQPQTQAAAPPPPPPAPAAAPPPAAGSGGSGSGGSASQPQTHVIMLGSPLVLDLSGKGIGTSDSKVNYDINGNGSPSSINDLSNGEGLLVLGNGSNGTQLFGNNTDLSQYGGQKGYKDGFAALKNLADIASQKGQFTQAEQTDLQNGKLDSGALDVLNKDYGVGIKVGSFNAKPESLTQAGVSEIDLPTGNQAGQMVTNFDGKGNNVESETGANFVRSDGSTGDYKDIWFNTGS